jgi:alpha-tubulin suppressor-like RCC1 family protein
MRIQWSALRVVVAGVALVGGCDGRDHAVNPDGGRIKQGAAGSGMVGAAGTVGAAGAAGAGAADAAAGIVGAAAPDAGPEVPATTNACDKAAGCCDQSDCPPKDGKVGSCDTATHACSYACAANMKSCNGACIAASACCVDTDCVGTCQLCGAEHACIAAKRVDDPTGRCSGTCDAAGKCKSKQGQHCMGTTSDGCLGAAPCVDGYCCNATCAGSCMACDVAGSEGSCTAVASGPPHGDHTACVGVGSSCGGACGGRPDGACVYPTTKCGATTCSGTDKVIGQGTCGAGICNPPQPEMCSSSFACANGACRTTCAANSDCQAGFTCSKGACFKALKVVSGQVHSCALLSDHTVRCWGDNFANQLGRVGESSFLPVTVGGLTGVKDIAAGSRHTCAVVEGGAVRCWGDNGLGQFGNAMIGGSLGTPTVVSGLSGATSISAGAEATCAVISGGAVTCWGNVPFPGNAAPGGGNRPVQAVGISSVTAIGVGARHICAVQDGEVWCWGGNDSGQVGQPPDMPTYPSPKKMGLGATAIAVFDNASCAVGTDGNVKCWGSAINGNTPTNIPTSIPGTGGSVGVGLGENYACALLSSGMAKCWGANSGGQLGLDPAASFSLVAPADAVSGVSGAIQIGTGPDHACTTTSEGLVRCWGTNLQTQCGAPASGTVFPASLVSSW